MPQFFFESDATEPAPVAFGGDPSVLVYFLSLAFSTRYGSQHDLSRLALLLRGEFKINMTPITTFADRDVEVESDAQELARVWQDAEPLAASLREVVRTLESGDTRVNALVADTPDLLPRLRDLLAMSEWASQRRARVRMTYLL